MPLVEYWEKFGITSDFEEVECADMGEGSLAARVLRFYNIPYDSSADSIGGELPNLDIKSMDAMQVIKSSLLEYSSKQGGVWEPVVNGDGEVEFKSIGTYDSGVEGYIYHQIQTMDYVEECRGVMVTGGKPLLTRKPVDWKYVWGDDKHIYKMDLYTSNCMKNDFSQYATIAFKDPHFDSNFEDGIANLYNIGKDNPYDEIIGYAYFKEPPQELATKNTEIKYANSSEIPIRIGHNGFEGNDAPDMGTLQKPPTYPRGDEPGCWAAGGLEADFSLGVKVDIPSDLRYESVRETETDTFVGISGVFLAGKLINSLFPYVADGSAVNVETNPNDIQLRAIINEPGDTVLKLSAGTQYEVAYDINEEGFKTPYIVFADLSKRNDPTIYGANKTIFVEPQCRHFRETGQSMIENITIFPIAETKAMWVKQIWVVAQLNTPSVVVFDPNGKDNRALQIAEGLEYMVSPIVIVNEPNPVAFNGTLIDLSQSKQDHDPRTAQNFSDTELEKAYDIMNGGGFSLTLSFLNADECVKLSQELYEYMNSLDGVETTYICGPACDPKLGGLGPTGGVINSINYSYTDSGSYTISVSEGPRIVGGFSDVSGGPTQKAAESITAEGVVLEDLGNHCFFKVRIDGFGDRFAINCCPSVLRVGDRISCSVHNNPVES